VNKALVSLVPSCHCLLREVEERNDNGMVLFSCSNAPTGKVIILRISKESKIETGEKAKWR
jgi:hypothetical protein